MPRHSPLPLLAMVALLGCHPDDDGGFSSQKPASQTDDDGDGYTADVDCDDEDSARHPDADELCDELDNDCDDLIDEDDAVDTLTWYRDEDGDGYGLDSDTVPGCTAPSGTTGEAGDCDDEDADRFPGNDETCDDQDNDCDDLIDEDATDPDPWYHDGDGDGYGDPSDVTYACDHPDDYERYGTDCDDTDATIHPGADDPCDGIDNDCDDVADEDKATWYADTDGDGYGDAASPLEACEEPTGYTTDDTDCDDDDATVHPGGDERLDDKDNDCDGIADEGTPAYDDDADGTAEREGDCDDADPEVHPGADEICGDGIDNDCDASDGGCALTGALETGDAAATMLGTMGEDYAGRLVAGAGDVNGDGLADVLVGAYEASDGATDAGALYLVLGPISGETALSGAAGSLVGSVESDRVGVSGAAPGDADGDGFADFAGGAYLDDSGGEDAGAVFVLYGPVSGPVAGADADAVIVGAVEGTRAGYSVAGVGDASGDGAADLLFGVPLDATVTTKAGAAYLVFGPATGALSTDDADAALLGVNRGDQAGVQTSAAGDLDGDGVSDLLVAAPYLDDAGSEAGGVYLVMGPVSGAVSLEDAAAQLDGTADDDEAGSAVGRAGDTDGDGYDDLLVGAEGNSSVGSSSGAAWLVLGPTPASGSLGDAHASIFGAAAGDRLGSAVSGAGDVDGDGFGDVLIGGWYEDTGARNAGSTWLIYGPWSGTIGPDDADLRVSSPYENARLGGSVAAAGDTDGDGLDDWLVGAHRDATDITDAGAAFLFLGAGM